MDPLDAKSIAASINPPAARKKPTTIHINVTLPFLFHHMWNEEKVLLTDTLLQRGKIHLFQLVQDVIPCQVGVQRRYGNEIIPDGYGIGIRVLI